MKRLFHYTHVELLKKILVSGCIRPADLHVDTRRERPVVWCTFSETWEGTATPAFQSWDGSERPLTFAEFCEKATPCRIEIKPECVSMDWKEWRRSSGVQPKVARNLENGAIVKGSNVRDWRMSFESIPKASWLSVEALINGQWKDIKKHPELLPPNTPSLELFSLAGLFILFASSS